MIPNMVDTVFQDIVENAEKEDTRKNDETKLANYFGQPKSETEDDADEIVIVESVNGLQGKN